MVFKGKDAITEVLERASTQMREVWRDVVYPAPKSAGGATCSLGRKCANMRLSQAPPEGAGLFDRLPLEHLKNLTLPVATGKVTSSGSRNVTPD